MKDRLTPEERAYEDAIGDAVDMGVYGEEALRYADHMRGTMWFQLRALHHAGVDFRTAFSETEIAKRLRSLVRRRDTP